jgi:hypothetical protein
MARRRVSCFVDIATRFTGSLVFSLTQSTYQILVRCGQRRPFVSIPVRVLFMNYDRALKLTGERLVNLS